jgi:hypothetical protein
VRLRQEKKTEKKKKKQKKEKDKKKATHFRSTICWLADACLDVLVTTYPYTHPIPGLADGESGF